MAAIVREDAPTRCLICCIAYPGCKKSVSPGRPALDCDRAPQEPLSLLDQEREQAICGECGRRIIGSARSHAQGAPAVAGSSGGLADERTAAPA
ncbi:hypothetical protein GCM10027569_85100 [Flindersiella endophytica]